VSELPAGLPGRVRVVGTGLVGTSVGLALTKLGVAVTLHDPSPSTMALAARSVRSARSFKPSFST